MCVVSTCELKTIIFLAKGAQNHSRQRRVTTISPGDKPVNPRWPRLKRSKQWCSKGIIRKVWKEMGETEGSKEEGESKEENVHFPAPTFQVGQRLHWLLNNAFGAKMAWWQFSAVVSSRFKMIAASNRFVNTKLVEMLRKFVTTTAQFCKAHLGIGQCIVSERCWYKRVCSNECLIVRWIFITLKVVTHAVTHQHSIAQAHQMRLPWSLCNLVLATAYCLVDFVHQMNYKILQFCSLLTTQYASWLS